METPAPNTTPLYQASISELSTELLSRVPIGIVALSYMDEVDHEAGGGSLMMDAKGSPFEVRGLSAVAGDYYKHCTSMRVLGRNYGKPEDDQDGEQWKKGGK